MRPPEVTDEEIIRAGQGLEAAHVQVSGFQLRKVLGGGSPIRLKKVWDAYQAAQSPGRRESPQTELPRAMAERLEGFIKAFVGQVRDIVSDLNAVAVADAEHRLLEVTRHAEEQRLAAEQEITDAAATLEELETERERLQNDLTEAQQALQRQTLEVERLRERERATETVLQAAKEMEQTLRAALAQAQQERDAARSAMDKQTGQIETMERLLKLRESDAVPAPKARSRARGTAAPQSADQDVERP